MPHIEILKNDIKLEETGFYYAMQIMQGKYKMYIPYILSAFEVLRFNELQRKIV